MIEKCKSLIKGFYQGKQLKKQLPVMLLGVFMMGFTMSWLNLIDWGTDTYTNMNLAISSKLGWTLGTWQLVLNILLLVIVLILGADNFGFGTIANMVLVGYLIDFFSWLWRKILPAGFLVADGEKLTISNENLWLKILIMVVALAGFVFFAALYMDAGLGVSPCDAVTFIVKKWLPKAPVKLIRIIYDASLIAIACAFGSKLYPVTILMALTLGPVIEFVGNRIQKWFSF